MELAPVSVRAASLHGVHGARWQVVEPGRELHWPTPVCAAGEPLDLLRWLATSHPDLGVLTLLGGVVHGRSGWAWTADGRLVEDVSWHFDRVAQADAQARSMGINGVPFFVFNQKLAASGAQAPEALLEAMRQAAG